MKPRGEEVIPLFLEDAREVGHGLSPVQLRGKWWRIVRYATRFDFALPLREQLARSDAIAESGDYARSSKIVMNGVLDHEPPEKARTGRFRMAEHFDSPPPLWRQGIPTRWRRSRTCACGRDC